MSSGLLHHADWSKFIDVSEVLSTCIIRVMITLMTEAASTSAMLVKFYQTTWCNDLKTAIFILILIKNKEWNLSLSSDTYSVGSS
jgi:hypothetical protein